MNDLERALLELEVEWPATPDLATTVRARLAAPPKRRRRWLGVLAAALVLVGGTLAVEPARSKVFHWLGITSVEIKPAPPRQPIPTAGASLGLGKAQPLAAARHVPALLGRPSAVYRTELPTGTFAESLVYPGPLLVQTFRASVEPFIAKTLAGATSAQKLDVDGNPAYWINGPHGFAYTVDGETEFETQRIAGRTLLVERRDGLLIRVEGERRRDRAIAIARSIQ